MRYGFFKQDFPPSSPMSHWLTMHADRDSVPDSPTHCFPTRCSPFQGILHQGLALGIKRS
jgi:hypothetical protein